MQKTSLYFTGPEAVDLRETNTSVEADEVLVETQFSGISPGTELLIYHGQAPSDLPADATLDALDGDLSYPLRYGYAAIGEVTEVGSAADQAWLGRTVLAFNPHETRFSARPSDLIQVPDTITPTEMALYPTVETATNLVLDGAPKIGDRVAVFGAGVVGLSTIGLLSSFPVSELLAVDPLASRRDRALEMGADSAVAPADLATDRWSDAVGPDGADIVFEVSGHPSALDQARALTGYDGHVVVGSWYGTKPTTLDLGGSFHRDRISLESSQVSTLSPSLRGRWNRERRGAVALDNLESIPVESLVTHRVPFENAPNAYRLLDEHPDEALQVLLTYQ